MLRNRGRNTRGVEKLFSIEQLTNGPSKVCMAMGIDKKCNHLDLCGDKLYLESDSKDTKITDIVFTPRINIDYAGGAALYHWRYYIRGSKFISVRKYEPLRSWRNNGYMSLKHQPNPDLFTQFENDMNTKINTDEQEKIKKLPKVELHLHLEGCIKVETLLKLASQNNVQLPKQILKQKSIYFATFDQFVYTYYSICNVLVEENDFRLVIRDVIDYVKDNNIIHCEVSWTPFQYLNRGMRFDHILSIMNDELEIQGMRNRIKFIIDTQRDHGVEVGKLVYSHAFNCRDCNIVGIGLTGQEQGFSPTIYRKLFQHAKQKGFGCTAHAGEYGSAMDIWQCVKDLCVTRIGHGIKAITDDTLMDYLKNKKIHLEISPTSNVRLKRVDSYFAHPFQTFWSRGLNVGINSDDPEIFGTGLTDECLSVMNYFGLSLDAIQSTLFDSIQASFISENEKETIKQQIVNGRREISCS